ncbi:MAG: AarF/ABC1/UbiB kinase family protein [Chloroflexi bacterium]|nr:MAG: AarF/ABC1/UbiB kinase family protein [Chloroflexota bacterium]
MLRNRYRRVSLLFARILISLAFWELLLPRIGFRRLVANTRSKRLKKIGSHFRARAIEMGGVLIKIGQFISSRVDVIPYEITSELAGLQDEVPPEKFEAIREIAEAELGGLLEEKYAEFDPIPLAAASLGQVHRAQIRGKSAWEKQSETIDNGSGVTTAVVVKVQRPMIEQIIATDMAALRTAGNWINKYRPIRKRADVPALINEFERVLLEEIDYLAEGQNAETFAVNFRDESGVRVPRVAWSHTTKKVLTLEDVQAIKITNYEAITKAGIQREEVAKRLLGTYLKQIFEDSFFHADPHPGNLFVAPLEEPVPAGADSDKLVPWQLTFVDFGMVGRLRPEMKAGLRELLIAVGTQDTARMIKAYQMMGVLLPNADVSLLEKAEREAFDRFWGKSMTELQQISFDEMKDFAFQFRGLIYDLPFQIPEDLILFGRAVGILSGMCTGLDPRFNVWMELLNYARKLMREEVTGSKESILSVLRTMLQRTLEIPRRTERVLAKMEQGQLAVRDPGMEEGLRSLNRSLCRMAGAVMFAALLLAGVQFFLAGQTVLAWILLGLSGLVFLSAIIK